MERWQKPEPDTTPCPAAHSDRASSLDCSAPLRSARKAPADDSRSPFYKLSAELSRESLRLPAAVPFLWEQSPGRRRSSSTIITSAMPPPQRLSPPPAADPAKRSLGDLLRQPSLDLQAKMAPPSAVKPIAQPPAMERPRSSSARQSGSALPASSLATTRSTFIDDALSDSASNAFTATAGAVSVDDSLALSGPFRPASTPSDARDFIMNRFLPAAHTIACESPQTPSRRSMRLGISAAPPAPAACGESFRDRSRAGWTDSTAMYGLNCKAINSLPCASPCVMPLQRRQVLEGSFHSAIDEVDDDPTEDDEQESPLRPRSCGFLPFRIQVSFHSRRSTDRAAPASKHAHRRSQQTGRKGSKAASHSHASKRIMDVLREDEASSYGGQSPVYHNESGNGGSGGGTNTVVASKLMPMLSSGSPCAKPRSSLDLHYRESPHLHPHCALCPGNVHIGEALKYRSDDAPPSRFCSPSPAALRGANERALHGNCLSNPHGIRSCAGIVDGSPLPVLPCPMETCIYNYGSCCCNTNNTRNSTPRSYHTQLSSPSSCLTPPPSHLSSSRDSFLNQDIAAADSAGFDAFSRIHSSDQRAQVINNALYEQDDQETISSSDMSRAGTFMLQTGSSLFEGTGLNNGSKTQGSDTNCHANAARHMNMRKIAENFSQNDEHITPNAAYDKNDRNLHNVHNASNGDSRRFEQKDDANHMNVSDLYACAVQYPHYCHRNCLRRASPHAYRCAHHVCNGNRNTVLHCAMSDEKNKELEERNMGVREFPRSQIAPPLPKSPTHSWLDRTMPLIASAAGKGPIKSTRFSDLRGKPAIAAAAAERAGAS